MISQTEKCRSTITAVILIAANAIMVLFCFNQRWEYLPGLVYVVVCFVLLIAHYLRPFYLWEKMVVFLVAGCIVAARGFVYLGVPLGKMFLPIGEMVIVSALILILHNKSTANFFEEKVAWWILIWFVYGMLRLLIAMPDVEFITLKSSCMIYYSLFAYFGFLVARRREVVDQLFKVLGISFLLLFFHFILYFPHFGGVSLSPKLYQGINLLGSFGSPYFHTIGGCFFFMIIAKYYLKWPQWTYTILAATFLALTILMQARSGFVALAGAIVIAVLWSDIRQKIKITNLAIFFPFTLLILISLIGLESRGGKGPVSADYVIMQIETIFGRSRSTFRTSSFGNEYVSVKGLVGTREGRIRIWKGVLSDNLQSPINALLGKGFGEPLLRIKLRGGVPDKRSPHNGYVLIFGYLGLIGLFLFLMFNFLFVKRIIKAIRLNKSKGMLKESDTLLWIFVYYAVMVTGALATPIFGTPYMAPIFYFLIGLGLSLSRQAEACHRDVDLDSKFLPQLLSSLHS